MRLLYIVHDMTTWPSLARDLNSKLAFWVWKFFRNSILSKLEFRISGSSRSIRLETIHSDWIILILGSAICNSVSRDVENVKIAADHCTSASTERYDKKLKFLTNEKRFQMNPNHFELFLWSKTMLQNKVFRMYNFGTKNSLRAKTFILTHSVSFRISNAERSP